MCSSDLELVLALMNRFARKRVSLSMPSMRVGTITPAIMECLKPLNTASTCVIVSNPLVLPDTDLRRLHAEE